MGGYDGLLVQLVNRERRGSYAPRDASLVLAIQPSLRTLLRAMTWERRPSVGAGGGSRVEDPQRSLPGPGKRTLTEQIRPAGGIAQPRGSVTAGGVAPTKSVAPAANDTKPTNAPANGVAPTNGVASTGDLVGEHGSSSPHHEGTATDEHIEHGFARQVREVISNAPEGMQAWNGTYEWDSRMHLALEPGRLTVTVRIFTRASEAVRAGWARAIADKWSGRMDLVVASGPHSGRYEIVVGVEWVERSRDADYIVKPHAPDGPAEDGRAGVGGTVSMNDWGTGDTTDVPHEFGHMLGNAEDYFTTNGVDHTHGGKDRGYRDDGGGIMNNPAEVPFAQHYATICQNVAEMLGAPATDCTTEEHRAVASQPLPPHDHHQAAP